MVADAEVARVDLDVLCVAGGLVQAGPPGDDAVQARVDRGGWDGQWPEAALQRQLDLFGVPFLQQIVRAPGVAVRVILEPDRPGMTSTAWPSPRGARASTGSVTDSAQMSQAERA